MSEGWHQCCRDKIMTYEKQLKKGDNIIFTAFGAGFTYGAVYAKWGYDGAERK